MWQQKQRHKRQQQQQQQYPLDEFWHIVSLLNMCKALEARPANLVQLLPATGSDTCAALHYMVKATLRTSYEPAALPLSSRPSIPSPGSAAAPPKSNACA